MEVRIKTAEEFWVDRVTIEIKATRAEAAELPEGFPGQRTILALRAQVESLETQLHSVRQELAWRIEEKARMVDNYEALQGQLKENREADHELVMAVRAERDAEIKRADENRDWAERTEAQLVEANRLAEKLSDMLGKVGGAVIGPKIQDALRTTWNNDEATAMKSAIREVRRVIGTPLTD